MCLRRYFEGGSVVVAILATMVLLPGVLLPGSAAAQAAGEKTVTVDEFQKAIAERDEIIIDLMHRVEELEDRLAGESESVSSRPKTPKPATPKRAALAQPPRSAAQTSQDDRAPGQVVVDELTAQRALERSLVETGALLLAPGQAEISPSVTFQHSDVADATAVSIGGSTFIADRTVARDIFDARLSVRHGLPWESQLELSVPYRFVAGEETRDILGSIQSSEDSNGHGVGDVRLGLAKTLLRAGNAGPDLIGRVTWDTGTGKRTDDGVPLGFGFDELEGRLTALYRQDPMVFIGTAGYAYTFERDGTRPGEEYLFSLGTTLAVSPETSLSFFLDQVYREEQESDGRRIDGSDQLASSFTFGSSIIVGPRTLLRLTAGIGLTDDAPDYTVGISLPIRFASPVVNR